mmetsp:Transcript_97863/g.218392  ORF Transcript_97863/g.218392 Transcript_97863/m.218392 type:complete len:603 (+) Transcript_97863:3-1811(+)
MAGVVHTLVGDARLCQYSFDGDKECRWLLHSPVGKAYLQSHPTKYLEAAKAASQDALTSNWAKANADKFELEFSTYSELADMYTLTKATLHVGRFGAAYGQVTSSAAMLDPYGGCEWLYFVDAVYCLLVVMMAYWEIKDIISAVSVSVSRGDDDAPEQTPSNLQLARSKTSVMLSEFMDYWNIWNVIDWISIVLGLINACLWFTCLSGMGDEQLHSWKQSDFDHMNNLSEEQLTKLIDLLETSNANFFMLQFVVALNTVSIILRYFKAFKANPWLNVVTETLTSVYSDVVHFMIVFFTVFMSFGVMGHVLFGTDVKEFYTLASSFNTGAMVLMGDFGWYVDLAEKEEVLPSGMPQAFVKIWFISYMIIVQVILLNMLLAIVLLRYSVKKQELLNSQADPIWVQCNDYARRMRKHRGFVSLKDLLNELDAPGQPAHEEPTVTLSSLMTAFPEMKEAQAAELMKELEDEVRGKLKQDRADEITLRSERLNRLLKAMDTEIQLMAPAFGEMPSRLERLESRLDELELGSGGLRPLNVDGLSMVPEGTNTHMRENGDRPLSTWARQRAQMMCCFESTADTEDASGQSAQTKLTSEALTAERPERYT